VGGTGTVQVTKSVADTTNEVLLTYSRAPGASPEFIRSKTRLTQGFVQYPGERTNSKVPFYLSVDPSKKTSPNAYVQVGYREVLESFNCVNPVNPNQDRNVTAR
jgi:hypothetical protein